MRVPVSVVPCPGATTLRALFWRKRNERLARRLNSVIETSERVRKSLKAPEPRISIDRSYLDALAEAEALPFQEGDAGHPGAEAGIDPGSAVEVCGETGAEQQQPGGPIGAGDVAD